MGIRSDLSFPNQSRQTLCIHKNCWGQPTLSTFLGFAWQISFPLPSWVGPTSSPAWLQHEDLKWVRRPSSFYHFPSLSSGENSPSSSNSSHRGVSKAAVDPAVLLLWATTVYLASLDVDKPATAVAMDESSSSCLLSFHWWPCPHDLVSW